MLRRRHIRMRSVEDISLDEDDNDDDEDQLPPRSSSCTPPLSAVSAACATPFPLRYATTLADGGRSSASVTLDANRKVGCGGCVRVYCMRACRYLVLSVRVQARMMVFGSGHLVASKAW